MSQSASMEDPEHSSSNVVEKYLHDKSGAITHIQGESYSSRLYNGGFFDGNEDAKKARAIYIKTILQGTFLVILTIWGVLSIFWGAFWTAPSRTHGLSGWVVDFDGGVIGKTVAGTFNTLSGPTTVSWQIRNASDFPNGPSDLAQAVLDEQVWVAISINPGSSARLSKAVANVDASYNGSLAVTAYAVEARNENAFRQAIRPNIDGAMQTISFKFAAHFAQQQSTNQNIGNLLSTAPQVITQPIYYTTDNIRPFNIPVASAATFVGLIYLLILSYFIAMIQYTGRQLAELDRRLSLRSLIGLRLITPLIVYFIVSLFYSLLSLAFKLPFDLKFGKSGFLVFWMLCYCGMLSLGLALEFSISFLTPKYTPFFLLLWIIGNDSVCVFPTAMMPKIYRYAHVAPFYHINTAERTIVFNTKSHLGVNFGTLFIWIFISCVTVTLIIWFLRWREIRAMEKDESFRSDNA